MPSDAVTVRLPRSLLDFWPGPVTSTVHCGDFEELARRLDEGAPGMAARLVDEQGQIRRHVAVFVNDAMVQVRAASAVRLKPGDRVQIVPSVSGG